ncbi:MAG: hypothetical protein R2695_10125 [Acidimicrobiales bacterium]
MGPATVVLSGTSAGLESSVYAIIGIAIAALTCCSAATTSSSRCTSSPSAGWACWPRPG